MIILALQSYYYKLTELKENLNFKFEWRPYQYRFLKDFEEHIHDKHLHLIAPPGSGKTVLGLEMIRRVNKKTLVLAPTLTIRNQWKERLLECFIDNELRIETSFDIKNLKTLTFSTYQSLHSLFKNDFGKNSASLLAYFNEHSIQTILLDEAHHLKNEWWKSLFLIKETQKCTTISLTATPPYDSSSTEIRKYFDLCGPIDVEIGVPELVKEGNLCPHQDYIYFSEPDELEIRKIVKYREALLVFVNTLQKDEEFIKMVQGLPQYAYPEESLELIYDNPKVYSAILIFLNSCGIEIDLEKTKILGVSKKDAVFPSFSYEWVEVLLQYLLVDNRETLFTSEEILKRIETRSRQIGAFRNKKIDLTGDGVLYKSLSQSSSKLKSISEIIKNEYTARGSEMRAVVLCDYIRKEFLNISKVENINSLGVLPVFHALRTQFVENAKYEAEIVSIAILTGSITVVNSHLLETLKDELPHESLSIVKINSEGYFSITLSERIKNTMVQTMTRMFEDGQINVLIGTKSLLGEGWDAPSINTLVLASFVGSFVMSNQMRGRAIRVDPNQANKVASIWHLACIDRTADYGGADVDKLEKRFNAFTGVSLKGEPLITNRIGRLGVIFQELDIEKANEKMIRNSANLAEVANRWKTSIDNGTVIIHDYQFRLSTKDSYPKKRELNIKDLTLASVLQLTAAIVMIMPEFLLKNVNIILSKGFWYFFYSILAGISFALAPRTYKALRLYFFLGRVDKYVQKIATVILEMMHRQQMLGTCIKEIDIVIEISEDGYISSYLTGATVKEQILFIDFLQETLEPIDNPRYLISQSNWIRKRAGFSSYYAVPKGFSDNKEKALLFHELWLNFVGRSKLVYTRNLDGRKILVKARFQQLKARENFASKKSVIWK